MQKRHIKAITITKLDVEKATREYREGKPLSRCCPMTQALKRVWKAKDLATGYTSCMRGERNYLIGASGQSLTMAPSDLWWCFVGTVVSLSRRS